MVWAEAGIKWTVLPFAVVKQKSKEDIPIQTVEGKAVMSSLLDDRNRALPSAWYRPLKNSYNKLVTEKFVPFDKKLSVPNGQVLGEFEKDFKLAVYGTPDYIKTWTGQVEYGQHAAGIPMVHLTDKDGEAWILVAIRNEPIKLTLKAADGVAYILSDFDDKTHMYKEWRRDMKFELPPLTAEQKAAVVDPVKEAPKANEKVEGVEDTPPWEEQKEEVKETPAVEPAKESDSAVKRTRKKAAKALLPDLNDIKDKLAADVPDDISAEEAINEVRQLRDLQLVITRRMANVALQQMQATAGFAAKIQQFKDLLK